MITLFLLMLCGVALSESSEGIGPTSGTCGESANWALDNGTLTISGAGSIDTVSWIGRKNQITEVIIQEGITSIDCSAFNECGNLETVSLPTTLKTIGSYITLANKTRQI